MRALILISLCVYIKFSFSLQLDESEDFRELKTGASVESINAGQEASVTVDLTSVSRKPFRVSGVSSVTTASGVSMGTLSNLVEVHSDDSSWTQSYSVAFTTSSSCDSEDDSIFLILTDENGFTKFKMVNFTLAPTCSQAAASLPLTSSLQIYSDSVFTTSSSDFLLGDTVYCRTEISTPASISAIQIISATLTYANNDYDLTAPEFQLQEYDSEGVSLVSFRLTGTQLTDVGDGSSMLLAITYALSYSSNFRRALSASDVIESRVSKTFRVYFADRCGEEGKVVTTKCAGGGEIVKICQSDGFHTVKDTCTSNMDIENKAPIPLILISFFGIIASISIGINSFRNTKKND